MRKSKKDELERKAAEIRLELLRMFSFGKAHHFGGSLSCVELVTSLYFNKMKYSAALSTGPERDRFIMSKGHAVPAQYVALAMHGVLAREELATIKTLGSRLQGHPDVRKTPGIEAPTGSLGQGLSFANGITLGARLDGHRFNIYLILGDGELQEGQVWEAAMTSTHYKIGNICVLVDNNGFQSQGSVNDLMSLEPLEQRWGATGWDVQRVDGHSIDDVCTALDAFDGAGDRPMAIIADTVKGKGISFMEDTYAFHNYALTEEEFRQAEAELTGTIDDGSVSSDGGKP